MMQSGPSQSPERLELNSKIMELLGAIDEQVADPFRMKLNSLIPAAKHRLLHQLGNALDALRDSGKEISVEGIKQIATDLELKLKDPGGNQGLFAVIHKHDPLSEECRPGYLMFAIIPPGHTATNHKHNSAGKRDVPGEITQTWFGTLKYPDENGSVMSHTTENDVRISPSGSKDLYIKQEDFWGGIYYQPELCEVIAN